MSDFTSGFWDFFIVTVTVASIVGCALLLYLQSRVKVRKDPAAQGSVAAAGPGTTGHVWDGDLTEYNHPLPRWWRNLFWITIVFSFVYLALYPGLGTFRGLLGWSQAGQYREEMTTASEQLAPLYAKYASMPIEAMATDREARGMGERLFLQHCAQCHGSDAGGARGFPSLRDRDWLYGGEPETILASISGGRTGIMPPQAQLLGDAEAVKNVVTYVRSLSGLPVDPVRIHLGKAKFAQACAACHGADGKGNRALGAPNLTDEVWLVGSSEAAITETLVKGRNVGLSEGTQAMPAFKGLLEPAQIRLLAGYVWGLSHPQSSAAARP
jgi:cytochrome c oxidase cbb3-type subunit 3